MSRRLRVNLVRLRQSEREVVKDFIVAKFGKESMFEGNLCVHVILPDTHGFFARVANGQLTLEAEYIYLLNSLSQIGGLNLEPQYDPARGIVFCYST